MRELIVSQLTAVREAFRWLGFAQFVTAIDKVLNNISLLDFVIELIEGRIGDDGQVQALEASALTSEQQELLSAAAIDWAMLWQVVQMIIEILNNMKTKGQAAAAAVCKSES